MVILTVTSILMLKIPAIRNDSDRPAHLVTRDFDDDAGSAIIRWAEAVSEQAGNSDTVLVSALTVIQ
jgi:hypothetical protein